MGRINIEEQLKNADQQLTWKFILAKVSETLEIGHNCNLVINIQNHRINTVQIQDFVAGASQFAYQLDRLE